MKKLSILLVISAMLLLAVSAVIALGPADNPTDNGFDKWGYNYRAHQFNGWYWNSTKPELPWTHETLIAAGKSTTWLIMQWSETWLSAEDRVDDGKLDRGCTFDKGEWTCTGTSATTGAWLTNHQRGTDEDGNEWTYYVEIVYPGYDPVDDGTGHDGTSGAPIIWTYYIVLKRVSSGSGATLYTQPVGFGAWR